MKTKRKRKERQVSIFVDVKIILLKDNSIETDVYYKPLNTINFLSYDGAHLDHTKSNIPYNQAKTIIVFVSNSDKL